MGEESETRDQRSGIRDQRSEIRDQRSETRDQRSEIRDQRSEIRDRGSGSAVSLRPHDNEGRKLDAKRGRKGFILGDSFSIHSPAPPAVEPYLAMRRL